MQEKLAKDSRLLRRKKKVQEWLSGNDAMKRSLLAFGFLVLLTFFLHFREVKMEVMEIGTYAPRYVIAQVDFDFSDEEATKTLRQEAVRDIGAIYKVVESEVHYFRRQLENSFIEKQQWRKELPRTTFDELYSALDRVEELLVQVRFSDDRTLHKMEDLDLSTEGIYRLSLRQPSLGAVVLPDKFWRMGEDKLERTDQFHPETLIYVFQEFSRKGWDLQQDFSLERAIKLEIQSEFPARYTHIDAGTQLVKRGEKVTPRHLMMMRAMKDAIAQTQNLWTPLTLLGSALLALCLTVIALIYLYFFHRDLLRSLQKVTLLATIIAVSLILAKCTEFALLYEGKNLVEVARFPLLLPFAAMLICVLVGSEMALSASLFMLVLFSVTLAVDHIPFILINFFAGTAMILFARDLHKRKEVFAVCGKVWLSCIPLILAFNLIENSIWNVNVIVDLASSFVFMAGTSLLLIGFLPLLESLFHVMTDMTLMDYMDPSHELLRRLSLEAPGTYQHCLVVGNLAEAGARAIGANGLFCRVSTLYHDIGKLFNPHYFTENQLGGFNIHQLLTPLESTQVIIAHVSEGESLARKHHLPQSFIDIIREHHGTTMVYYFYCKQVEQMEGDVSRVNEKQFRYPGPKPRSKESAIIMIADTAEAASRSMNDITEESMTAVIDKLVAEKANDGQLDECQLTFEELGRVKKAMVKSLIVTRHLRIKYPERH
jgi:putative nucleotidyltransferase with HDIG domain